MAGTEYCHDRADEPPDKEEYEKAMGEPLPPNPGEFVGLHLEAASGILQLVNKDGMLIHRGHILFPDGIKVIACWAHTAWTAMADDLPKYNSPDTWMECQKNAAAWLALAKAE